MTFVNFKTYVSKTTLISIMSNYKTKQDFKPDRRYKSEQRNLNCLQCLKFFRYEDYLKTQRYCNWLAR